MSTDLALHWISEWGSFGLFPLLALGIVGLPVPDETLLASAGFFIASGELHPVAKRAAIITK
jgi:membrane protein DedA with SNARE-associated domain